MLFVLVGLFFKLSNIHSFIYHMRACVFVCTRTCVWRSEDSCGGWFLSSIIYVVRVKLGSQVLNESVFTLEPLMALLF